MSHKCPQHKNYSKYISIIKHSTHKPSFKAKKDLKKFGDMKICDIEFGGKSNYNTKSNTAIIIMSDCSDKIYYYQTSSKISIGVFRESYTTGSHISFYAKESENSSGEMQRLNGGNKQLIFIME